MEMIWFFVPSCCFSLDLWFLTSPPLEQCYSYHLLREGGEPLCFAPSSVTESYSGITLNVVFFDSLVSCSSQGALSKWLLNIKQSRHGWGWKQISYWIWSKNLCWAFGFCGLKEYLFIELTGHKMYFFEVLLISTNLHRRTKSQVLTQGSVGLSENHFTFSKVRSSNHKIWNIVLLFWQLVHRIL